MLVRVIGVDCATRDSKVGVAFGNVDDGQLSVSKAFVCSKKEKAAASIVKWLREQTMSKQQGPALIALDAPLGWPSSLSLVLSNHRAGGELAVDAHQMFRRQTDMFVKRKTGKTPLDVGAGRIARTAYSALQLLKEIRLELKLDQIPLAWDLDLTEALSAIEVYPAATLKQYRCVASGYKRLDENGARKNIVGQRMRVVFIHRLHRLRRR